MIEVKTLGGGLNMDDSKYRLPPNDYIDALNISHDAVEGSNDQIITPIIANRRLDSTFSLPSGTNKTIGSNANTLRNTIIQFNWNSNGYHQILEGNLMTRIVTKIFENLTDSDDVDILGFTEDGKITSVNVYNREEGDLLFFLDSLGRPTEMDITLFKAGTYTPVTRAIIDVAPDVPLSPPDAVYGNDTTRRANNFRSLLTRYAYRWILDDFSKTTFSPISKVPLPVSILSDIYTNVITNNNVIQMVSNTGGKNVKAIELAFSFSQKTNEWSNFQSIATLEKSTLGLNQETILTGGSGLYDQAYVLFSGVVIAGTVVNIYLTALPNTQTLVATYTVLSGDTTTDVVNGLVASMVTIGIIFSYISDGGTLLFLYYNPTYSFDEVEIIQSTSSNDNIDFPFLFYNDSTYPDIPPEEGPIEDLYDYTPPKANAQELLNGNVLGYIGITEGYDKNTTANSIITVGTIAAGGTGGGTSFSAVQILAQNTFAGQLLLYNFSGIPAVGTVVEVKVKNKFTHIVITASTYTTIAGDTPNSVASHLAANNTAPRTEFTADANGLFTFMFYDTYEPIVTTFYSQLIITSPSSASANNSIPTFPWSTEQNIARGYFDAKGVTNGILYTDKVTYPAYNENGSQEPLLPYINYKINDIPPIWAKSMQFYLTKEGTQYIAWVTNAVNTDETAYIYFDVSNFLTNATKIPATAKVLSYSFKEGDRVRIWRESPPSTVVFPDTYDSAIDGLVVDPVINLVPKTGTFIKIKNIAPFTGSIVTGKNYVIYIYTPVQQSANKSNQVYYEFGQQYDIIDAGLPTRRHSGMVTDQVVGVTPAEYNFYEGEAYFRTRTIAVSEIGYATYNVIDRNFVDIYLSAVNSVDGRPSIIDINARQAYYSTLIRHGQAYQANTNINGLNRFYANNFDEYDISKGDGLRLVMKDKHLIVMQKFKIGTVPLFSSIGKDPNGLTVVFNTDKLLNPIQYYVGDFGIGTCPESVASFNFAIYGCDNIKGIIWRLSNDGLVNLSEKYKMNSWANDNLPLRNGDNKIYGAFDQRLNNYIIAPEAVLCVGVEVPDFTLNDALANEYFDQRVTLTGSLDFTIDNVITKPGWMGFVIRGYTLIFYGTPSDSDIADDVPVTFDIINDCGLVTVDKTINVLTAPCEAVAIVGTPELPDGAVDTPYSYSFDITGTAPFNLTAIVKPSWMTIAVSGSSIVFSGTPDSSGTDIDVSFTINNCSGDTADFADTFDVSAENWFIVYSNNNPVVNLEVLVGNNNTPAVNTLYSGAYSSDPLSGTDLVNLPAVNMNVILNVDTYKISFASCNGVSGVAGGSSVVWTGVTGGPLIINFTTTSNSIMVLLSNNSGTICSFGSPANEYVDGVFGVGKIIYTSAAMTTPELGYGFVVYNNTIYTVDAGTGEITGVFGSCP